MVVADEKYRTRRVDKGKSGQALNCGEWRLWGRHPLTVNKSKRFTLFGETELTLGSAVEEQ